MAFFKNHTFNYSKPFLFLAISLLIISCESDPPLLKIDNLNGNHVSVFGHGGMGIKYIYPINSYESIEKSLSLGSEGTEFDVQMTRDSVLIAYHHSKLDGATQCSGIINDKNWPEISHCTYNLFLLKNPALISLDKLFSSIENLHNYIYTFDCKFFTSTTNPDKYINQFTNAIIRIVEKYELEDNIFIESPSGEFLKNLKDKKENYKLFIYPATFEHGLKTAEELGLYGITISTTNITKEQISLAHSRGIRVTIWNTHTEKRNIEGMAKNPDCIQTDKLKHLLSIVQN